MATNQTWDEVSLRNLKDIHPDLRKFADAVLAKATWKLRVTEGRRTIARQKQLVAQKFSKTMKSRHITGHAIDVVPYVDFDRDGKIETSELYRKEAFMQLIPIAKAVSKELGIPIVFGYDWGWDMPHWELDRRKYPA